MARSSAVSATRICLLALLAACASAHGQAASPESVAVTRLPTGGQITPTAAPGSVLIPLVPAIPGNPDLPASFAQTEALSPDGKTLLVLCTGYNYVTDAQANYLPAASTQYVFVFDVSGGTPVQRQVVQVSNSYVGIAFAPDGHHFYVAGGVDDSVHVFEHRGGLWVEATPVPLNHTAINGFYSPDNPVRPTAADIAVTADGKRALVSNRFNDSLSIIDLAQGSVVAEQDLRPGKSGGRSGQPGGEYPGGIAIVGNTTAFVSSARDREVVVVDISGANPAVVARIPVQGHPNRLLLNKAQTLLFVASDAADVVTVVDTREREVLHSVATLAPAGLLGAEPHRYKGASPTGLALSRDETTLYVSNRGTNSVAVISLARSRPEVIGQIPTGFNPSDVRLSRDGRMLYVSDLKRGVVGPNRGCFGESWGTACELADDPITAFIPNLYLMNHIGSSLLAIPVPGELELGQLTTQVAVNNGFGVEPSDAVRDKMRALRSRIQHVIYVIKENRTFDQVLGDLGKGNGDPSLTEFPRATTPSLHAAAASFVTLDNFYCPGDVSGNGWPISTSARESEQGARDVPTEYAGNGGSYDWEGPNRGVNTGYAGAARLAVSPATSALDADTLPGTASVGSPDGPDGEVGQGYLWNAALRAHQTVRNYGVFSDQLYYNATPPNPDNGSWAQTPLDPSPFADGVVQAYAGEVGLAPLTDPYFRGFDATYPDFYREAEWEREFRGFVANGNLPNLTIMDLMGDHTGGPYSADMYGVNTPELQVADNDYAMGRIIQAVANSPYAGNTLIFVVEDDAQDGPDHVDSHRTTAYVVGPYVRQGAVVSTHYTTVNMLRTITDILGLDHLSIFDAHAGPMADVFDLGQKNWSFTAVASSLLRGTALPIPADTPFGPTASVAHGPEWWAAHTAGFNFSGADRANAAAYNQVLWSGLMGGTPYRSGRESQADAGGMRPGQP